MKTIISFFIISILSIATCTAQSFNQEVVLDGQPPMLLGKINETGLKHDPYKEWFSKNYSEYIPNPTAIDSLTGQLNEYSITVFMGTWCGDSKREVPKFYKILNSSNFPLDRLTTVAVNRTKDAYKQSPGGEHEGLNIHRVPTFIFYKNGKEINRIVESPKHNLEADILKILSGKYRSKYASVNEIDDILNKNGSTYIRKNGKKLSRQFKDKTQSMYELNTYANVLFYANKKDEALSIFELNTLLYPKNQNVYISIANKYAAINDVQNAIKHYQKALEIEDNPKVKDKIQKLISTAN